MKSDAEKTTATPSQLHWDNLTSTESSPGCHTPHAKHESIDGFQTSASTPPATQPLELSSDGAEIKWTAKHLLTQVIRVKSIIALDFFDSPHMTPPTEMHEEPRTSDWVSPPHDASCCLLCEIDDFGAKIQKAAHRASVWYCHQCGDGGLSVKFAASCSSCGHQRCNRCNVKTKHPDLQSRSNTISA